MKLEKVKIHNMRKTQTNAKYMQACYAEILHSSVGIVKIELNEKY